MLINVDELEASQVLPGGIHIGHLELVYFKEHKFFLCDIDRISPIQKLYDIKVLIIPFNLNGIPIYYRNYYPETRMVEIYKYT